MFYLFDIDGTLIRSGGAGRRAMDRAFESVHGLHGAFDAIDFRGTVDSRLLEEVHMAHGRTLDDETRQVFMRSYLTCLEDELGRSGGTLCPGVEHALEALEARGYLGLVTGNWREGAIRKLTAFRLWERFGFGGFGDDGRERSTLVRVAMARGRERGLLARAAVVVGDTPADVRAARAAGALAVAVGTGWCTMTELAASGPDLLLPDLEHGVDAILALQDLGA